MTSLSQLPGNLSFQFSKFGIISIATSVLELDLAFSKIEQNLSLNHARLHPWADRLAYASFHIKLVSGQLCNWTVCATCYALEPEPVFDVTVVCFLRVYIYFLKVEGRLLTVIKIS